MRQQQVLLGEPALRPPAAHAPLLCTRQSVARPGRDPKRPLRPAGRRAAPEGRYLTRPLPRRSSRAVATSDRAQLPSADAPADPLARLKHVRAALSEHGDAEREGTPVGQELAGGGWPRRSRRALATCSDRTTGRSSNGRDRLNG